MNRKTEVVIKPKRKWLLVDFPELWRYRELFYIFAWRDIKVRYKQTMLGALWALFQPLSQMFIFTIFFGRLAQVPSGELPYSLFVLVGLVFWGFFSGILINASNSLVENESVIKKVYFPRIILPLSKIVSNFVDFLIAFVLLLAVIFYYGFSPNSLILLILPLGLIITALGTGGLGLLLSAVNVKYRDVRYILPFFIQILIFLSPVIYPTIIMRPFYRYVMALNPMTGVIESMRTIITGSSVVNWNMLGISMLSATMLFIIGLYYFRATERFFADIV